MTDGSAKVNGERIIDKSSMKPAVVNLASFIECQVFWAVYVLFRRSETLQFDNNGVSSLLGNFVWTLLFVIALKFSQKKGRYLKRTFFFLVKLVHPEGKFRELCHL